MSEQDDLMADSSPGGVEGYRNGSEVPGATLQTIACPWCLSRGVDCYHPHLPSRVPQSGVEGVQALIEKWRKEAQAARIALGTIGLYRRVPRWEWDAIKHTEQHADELEALLALRPQLVEKKDEEVSRVDRSSRSAAPGSTAREQPDSSQR